MKNLILSAMMIAAIFTSCSKDDSDYEGYGNIAVNVNSDVNLSAVQTRAAVTDEKELANYTYFVEKTGMTTWSGTYAQLTSATFTAATSAYYLSAQDCTEADAKSANNNFGKMRLYGKSDAFTITAGQTTTVDLKLTVANSKVSVVFDNSLSTYFSTYTVQIGETGRMLTFADANTEAYFNAGTELKYSISATLKTRGATVTFANTVKLNNNDTSNNTTVAAKYYKITIKATSDKGQVGLSLDVDSTLSEATGEVDIDPYATTTATR
jgi:hypothetical protein